MKIRFSYSSLDFGVFFFFSLQCNCATLVYASVTKENKGVTI